MADAEKRKIRRNGPKYYCPYWRSYYYLKTEAEACRDSCFEIVQSGGTLPQPKTPDLSISDVKKHRENN